MNHCIRLAGWLGLLAVACCASPASAEPKPPAQTADGTYQTVVRPFLARHCVACHGLKKQQGELRLDHLPAHFGDSQTASKWVEVMDRLNLGEMPPEDEPRPDIEQLRQVTGWVADRLREVARRELGTGRVILRRMNRTEYANTIRDLLGMQFLPGEGPLALLPPDGTAEGFDKVSAALMMDPSLLEKYYEVANLIAREALVNGPPKYPTELLRFEFEDTHKSGGIGYLCSKPGFVCREHDVMLMEGGTRSFAELKYPGTRRHIATKGQYAVRVRASALPGAEGKPVIMRVTQGHPEKSQQFVMEVEVHARPDNPKVYETTLPRDEKGGEWSVSIVNGSGFTKYNRDGGELDKAIRDAGQNKEFAKVMRLRGRMHAEGLSRSRPNPETTDHSKLPRLFLDWIEVEGPLYEQWPPKSHQILLFKGDAGEENLEYAREIFSRFLPQAWRRPVAAGEIDAIVGIVKQELEHEQTFHDAIRAGLVASLTSPKFLYLYEPSAEKSRPLNDYELATRLSYFLWSSMPDEELFDLAKQGRLRDPQVLSAQVDRMLKDEKVQAFVEGFGAQWMRTDEFRNFTPDAKLYPDYDDKLGEAMVGEAVAFFAEILKHDHSVLNFIDADWTMANERLAKFYGIEGVAGDAFRRVHLPAEAHRGGLITMAGVLMRGSDGNRTKPVNRGVYVREVLFNDPPDPPPPNVGEIEPNIQGKNLTVRQRLLQHQQIESCAACHRTIDPYGLALENYNAIGAWRTEQDGEDFRRNRPPIVASGTLPGGKKFENVDEYKQILLSQKARFCRAVAEKMLIYGLGRPIGPADRSTVDDLAKRLEQNDYTMRSLIQGIVTTRQFLHK